MALALGLAGLVPMRPVRGQSGADDLRMDSVFTGSGRVYASTSRGIYRARADGGPWEKVSAPSSLPPSGNFASGTDADGGIYYVASRPFRPGNGPGDPAVPLPTPAGLIYGLHRMASGGGAWEVVPGDYHFLHVLADGRRLFALVTESTRPAAEPRVIESTNRGDRWRELPALPREAGMPFRLLPDPDHPGQVCVQAHGLRTVVLQAADARYEWQVERELAWQRRRPPGDARQPIPGLPASGIPWVPATLGNYFAVPAGLRTPGEMPGPPVLPGLWLETGTNRVLAVGGEVKLDVRIRMLAGSPPPGGAARKLVDVPGAEDLWFLTGFGPSGEALVVTPRRSPADVRRDPGWKATPFGPGSSLERVVNLSSMTSWATPGRYRVRVVYDSYGVSQGRKDEWAMQLVSGELEIEVKQGARGRPKEME